jgi:hypothetical protein
VPARNFGKERLKRWQDENDSFLEHAPCSLVEVDRRFRDAYCLHHHDICETSVYFNELYGAMSQKSVIFILAAVRTWNLTQHSRCSELENEERWEAKSSVRISNGAQRVKVTKISWLMLLWGTTVVYTENHMKYNHSPGTKQGYYWSLNRPCIELPLGLKELNSCAKVVSTAGVLNFLRLVPWTKSKKCLAPNVKKKLAK